jgi:hypothetical protein
LSRRPRLPPIVRYVYVIGPTRGLQKIGMATDPQTRLAALQTASPVDLLIHAAIAVPFGAAPDVEHQAHRLLGRMCVRNEWFEATPAEALFAVYTAALPWMEKLTTLRRLEPEIMRLPVAGPAPRAPSSLVAAAALDPLRRQDASPMDPLPLFRERA